MSFNDPVLHEVGGFPPWDTLLVWVIILSSILSPGEPDLFGTFVSIIQTWWATP